MKKYQVFISSTYVDLKHAREKAMYSVLSLGHFPAGMELFGATNADSWSKIQSELDRTDYYVLIIGNRYGSIEKKTGISYTEKEYDYAMQIGIPVIAFIVSDDTKLKMPGDEDPSSKKKLDNFKKKVRKDHNVAFWKTYDELYLEISQSLSNEMNTNPRLGYVRAKPSNKKTPVKRVISPTEDRIEKIIRRYPNASIDKIAKTAGVTKRTMNDYMGVMVRNGRVKRVGNAARGFWSVEKI